ncbi:conserved hypothetical protein [Uncinocarpus reesii 1704]|uniref:DUF4604 domain-containing protein n=1 Tax=Uncinocarpus reesii (strain UAMH 1704) TaxID=336963 RepID=C4JV05_UNCRE|nr:uncharacterized protein UREG_04958 [Uncinocarpus reesii 1704]EEP80116.1 conserved hypothetical protein [Uncinocarpus reesii 1704]
MSFKAKNLTYEKNEPAFLRRLRGQYGDGTGQRHGPSNVRPIKAKDPDADDEPTYVDEESNEVISKEEYQAMLQDAAGNTAETHSDGLGSGDQNHASKSDKTASKLLKSAGGQKVAEIGGSKKKKFAMVVAEDDQIAEKGTQPRESGPPNKKQKKKKIKLSFDEDVET